MAFQRVPQHLAIERQTLQFGPERVGDLRLLNQSLESEEDELLTLRNLDDRLAYSAIGGRDLLEAKHDAFRLGPSPV